VDVPFDDNNHQERSSSFEVVPPKKGKSAVSNLFSHLYRAKNQISSYTDKTENYINWNITKEKEWLIALITVKGVKLLDYRDIINLSRLG